MKYKTFIIFPHGEGDPGAARDDRTVEGGGVRAEGDDGEVTKTKAGLASKRGERGGP